MFPMQLKSLMQSGQITQLKPLIPLTAAILSIVLVIAGMLINLAVRISVRLRGSCCHIRLTARFFYALIPINILLYAEYLPCRGIRFIHILKNGEFKILGLKKRRRTGEEALLRKALVRALLNSIRLKKIEITGEAGIKSNAVLTVLLAGFLTVLLKTLVKLILFNIFEAGEDTAAAISFFPCMTRNAFSLNMEGIVKINMIRLIKKAGIALINQNTSKGDIKNAPYRKHNADLHGAN